ncbi:HD domain-containing phosphohydrolase [Stenotrophomonas sp. SbOxS2]|uniref:HD-GYP domain-containing protein n=1 Tax=Stenotrophomonas sp. SbOxS2 TaxID=2723885 RepID=UPI0031B8716C
MAIACSARAASRAVVLEIALHHHEKMDGTGYPHRLAGEEISLMARMSAICDVYDVYDAISSDRPYKRGWDPAESLKQMASWKGHFDPISSMPLSAARASTRSARWCGWHRRSWPW